MRIKMYLIIVSLLNHYIMPHNIVNYYAINLNFIIFYRSIVKIFMIQKGCFLQMLWRFSNLSIKKTFEYIKFKYHKLMKFVA